MPSYNKVILIGHLTRDIEVRFLTSGSAVAECSLAVNETWKDKSSGEKKETVSFIDCTLWGKTAELAGKYLKKGSAVMFEGKLKQDTWEDKESGQKRSKLKVTVEHMTFIGGGQAGQRGDSSSNESAETPYSEFDPVGVDDSPF